MLVNMHNPGFVCMLPPKTATSTVSSFLRGYFPGAHLADTQFMDNREVHPGLSTRTTSGYLPDPDQLQKHSLAYSSDYATVGLLTLITCRNPYSRAVSLWKHIKANYIPTLSFAEWATHPDLQDSKKYFWMCLPQTAWAKAACPHHVAMGNDPQVDLALRAEHLPDDLNHHLPRRLGFTRGWLGDQPIPRINKSEDATAWWEHYQDEQIRVVQDLYMDDFELFDYVIDFDINVKKAQDGENGTGI
jgi:hypothetical protein